jgi:TolB-like protein
VKLKLILVLFVFCLTTTEAMPVQSLDKEMSALAGSLSKTLVAQGSKNVAAIDFTDLQGQPTELGRFLSEQLSVEMVLTGGVSMLDRANIKSILAEHKLTEEGLVNPANAKKLGEFAGVDAILTGNVTSLDAGIVLTVKAISTDSARIVAAGRLTVPKTSDIQQLLNRGIFSSSSTSTNPSSLGGETNIPSSYRDSSDIATKDIGSLRVILKSVVPIRQADGRYLNAIRCSFEFINLETQRSIVVAMNAEPERMGPRPAGAAGGGVAGIPSNAILLRSSLIDDQGGTWRVPNSAATGVGIVQVGKTGPVQSDPYFSPTEIVALLERQDELKTNIVANRDRNGNVYSQYQFLSGSMTTIAPGQRTRVSLDFVASTPTSSSSAPKFFASDLEIVVGIVAVNTRKTYSLQNLTFDRVGIPDGGGR